MRRLAAAFLVSTALITAHANEPPPPDTAASVQLPPGASAAAAGLVAFLSFSMDVDVTYGAEITDKPGVAGLRDVVMTERLPAGATRQPLKVTMVSVEATGFDAEAAALLATDEPGQPMRSIADRIDVTGMVVGDEYVAIRVGSSSVEGLVMKPAAFRLKLPAEDLPLDPEQALIGLAHVVQAFGHIADSGRFTRATARDVTYEMDLGAMGRRMQAENPGMPEIYPEGSRVTYTIAELTQDGFDRGRMGRGEARNLSAVMTFPPVGDITLTMREMWLDGFDISKVVPSMMEAQWPAITREPLLGYGANCSYDILVRVPRIGEFAVPEFCMDALEFTYLIPKAFDFTIKGVFTPADDLAAPPYVAKYFTHALDFTVGYGGTYDPDSGVASLTHYGLDLEEFGAIDFKVAGGGFQLEGLPLLPANYLQTLSLVSGELELVDEGGIAKFLDITATMQTEAAGEGGAAVTPEALKMQAAMGVNMMVGALGNTPEAAAMGESIRNFLDKGGKLQVGVKPATPLVSADFTALSAKTPAEMVGTLGAYATWTAP